MSDPEVDRTLTTARRRRQDYLDRLHPHRCQPYLSARGEVIDPADQDGIGCSVCLPPDGRWHPWTRSQITEQERATRQEQTGEDEDEIHLDN